MNDDERRRMVTLYGGLLAALLAALIAMHFPELAQALGMVP